MDIVLFEPYNNLFDFLIQFNFIIILPLESLKTDLDFKGKNLGN